MAVPESIKEKIRSLSLKTVANGASESEAAAARAMILRLKEKYGDNSYTPPNKQSEKVSYEENLKLYREYLQLGTLDRRSHEIDWDSIAKYLLTDANDYHRYLSDTHSMWTKKEMTAKNLSKVGSVNYLTEKQYRIECYEKFRKIYGDRT